MTAASGQAGASSRVAGARPWVWAAWLLLAFALRLGFGVTSEFWGEDEHQIYLIGLRFFTTGVWPDFGPDVVYTHTQIPGGLQGLLIAGPLWILRAPEAPYILLNLLSLGVLVLLGWYIGRRLPAVPRWFLWGWILSCPWTLDISTHIYNPSYVLTGAVLFWIGTFELVPALRLGLVPRPLAFGCLGFGLLWVAQLHLSAPVLAVVAVVVFLAVAREDRRAAFRGILPCVIGAAVIGSTLVPTFVHHGVISVISRTGENVTFEPANLLRLPQVAAQYVSFGTFEIARFVGSNTPDRLAFLARFWWAAPFVLIAAAIGIVQAAVLLAGFFWRGPGLPGWRAVRGTTVLVLALVYLSFLWSVRTPTSHTFYVVLPVVLIYSFYCWAPILETRAGRIVAGVLLVSGLVTHVAVAVRNFEDRSLYVNRPLVVRAIREHNYHLIGERRPGTWN